MGQHQDGLRVVPLVRQEAGLAAAGRPPAHRRALDQDRKVDAAPDTASGRLGGKEEGELRSTWRLNDRVLVKKSGHRGEVGGDLYGHVGDLIGFGNGHARVRMGKTPRGEEIGVALIPYDDLRNVTKRSSAAKKEDDRPIGERIAARQGRKRR